MAYRQEEALLSFVTPVYNGERYISQTIQSVLNQTFRYFELLIVDDGSKDRTVELARGFAAADCRVRVFERPNGGAAAARNSAIRHARGQYFTLLDSDDVLMPSYAAEQVAILQAHPGIDILSANMINLGGPQSGTPLRAASGPIHEVSLQELIAIEDSVCIVSTVRRSVVERVGPFDETLRTNEDYDLWLRAARTGCRIFLNPKPLAYYRRRPDSASANEAAMLAGIVAVLRKARPSLAECSEELKTLDRQVRRFESRRLLVLAASSLERGDLSEAAEHLSMLARTSGNAVHYGLAAAARRVPWLLRWGYFTKKACRDLRRPRRAASLQIAGEAL